MWGKDKPRLMRGDRYWREPLKWDREAALAGERRRVFCASLADVFEDHPDVGEARSRLWDLIEATPNLDWLLLTKRPENVLDMVPLAWLGSPWPGQPPLDAVVQTGWPENVWIGTTVENQRYLNVRMRHMARIPAPVRFLSMEPLLGPVDLTAWIDDIDWVIVGGEANHADSRPMHPDWVHAIIRQCEERSIACPNDTDGDGNCEVCARRGGRHDEPIPVLFKQWGDWLGILGPLDVTTGVQSAWVNAADGSVIPDDDDPALDTGSWMQVFRFGKHRLKGHPFDREAIHGFPLPWNRRRRVLG